MVVSLRVAATTIIYYFRCCYWYLLPTLLDRSFYLDPRYPFIRSFLLTFILNMNLNLWIRIFVYSLFSFPDLSFSSLIRRGLYIWTNIQRTRMAWFVLYERISVWGCIACRYMYGLGFLPYLLDSVSLGIVIAVVVVLQYPVWVLL